MEKRPLDNKIKYGGSNSDSLDSELNFIPFKECPFEYAASVTLPPLVNGPETPSSDWQAIIGAIIPTVIAACLISTCYFCYRYGTVHRKTNSELFLRQQNYAIVLVRNVSRRSSFRRASNTNRSNRAREADQLNNHEITFSNGQNQNRQNIYHQNHNSNVSKNRLLFIFSMNRVFRVNRFYEVSCFRKIDFYDLFEESGFSVR